MQQTNRSISSSLKKHSQAPINSKPSMANNRGPCNPTLDTNYSLANNNSYSSCNSTTSCYSFPASNFASDNNKNLKTCRCLKKEILPGISRSGGDVNVDAMDLPRHEKIWPRPLIANLTLMGRNRWRVSRASRASRTRRLRRRTSRARLSEMVSLNCDDYVVSRTVSHAPLPLHRRLLSLSLARASFSISLASDDGGAGDDDPIPDINLLIEGRQRSAFECIDDSFTYVALSGDESSENESLPVRNKQLRECNSPISVHKTLLPLNGDPFPDDNRKLPVGNQEISVREGQLPVHEYKGIPSSLLYTATQLERFIDAHTNARQCIDLVDDGAEDVDNEGKGIGGKEREHDSSLLTIFEEGEYMEDGTQFSFLNTSSDHHIVNNTYASKADTSILNKQTMNTVSNSTYVNVDFTAGHNYSTVVADISSNINIEDDSDYERFDEIKNAATDEEDIGRLAPQKRPPLTSRPRPIGPRPTIIITGCSSNSDVGSSGNSGNSSSSSSSSEDYVPPFDCREIRHRRVDSFSSCEDYAYAVPYRENDQ